jgi:hypothetical protein
MPDEGNRIELARRSLLARDVDGKYSVTADQAVMENLELPS